MLLRYMDVMLPILNSLMLDEVIKESPIAALFLAKYSPRRGLLKKEFLC